MRQAHGMSRTYAEVPTPNAFELPIFQHVVNGRRYRFSDICTAMVAHFDLTPEQERMTFPYARGANDDAPSGKNVFYKYCNNACRSLLNKEWLLGEGDHYETRDYSITDQEKRQVTR